MAPKWPVSHTFSPKIAKNAVFFTYKYLTKYTPEMFFEEYIHFKNFSLLKGCGVILVQSF
jgi:hypothetical protein